MNWLAVGSAAAVLVVSSASVFAQAHVAGSERFVRATADRTMSALNQTGISDADRRARLRLLFNDAFAIRGIASYVLGRSWRSATPAQQEEFLKLFEEITVATWALRFNEIAGQQFVVLGAVPAPSAVPGENAALVRTELRPESGGGYKIDWRIANKDALYKITDVMVEGISLANTHRDEYASVIARQGGINGLLKVLRDKRDGLTTATAQQAGRE
jgi:phospholipid transport system substrate-binding protein